MYKKRTYSIKNELIKKRTDPEGGGGEYVGEFIQQSAVEEMCYNCLSRSSNIEKKISNPFFVVLERCNKYDFVGFPQKNQIMCIMLIVCICSLGSLLRIKYKKCLGFYYFPSVIYTQH